MCEERQSAYEATEDTLKAMIKFFPQLAPVINAQVLPTAMAQLQADKAVSPEYAKITADLYAKYGPEMAKVAAGIDDYLNKAASQRELDLAQTTGRELVRAADELQRQADPEFYRMRSQLGDNLARYLALSSPEVNEAELEAMRRGMGATQVNPRSAIDSAARAMQFGQLGRQRISDFGAAIGQVAQSLPALRANIPAFEIATRRQVGQTGGERVQGAATNTGQQAYGMGNNFLNQIGAFKQEEMRKQKSLLENVTGWGEFGGRVIGAIGAGAMCWVARAVYGDNSPKWVKFRDEYLLKRAPWYFRFAYMLLGPWFGKFIQTKPRLKNIVRKWMDKKLKEVGGIYD